MTDVVLPQYILIEKKIGETPKEAIERLRLERPELAGVKLGYAGRLDPMAHGLLLILVGEENKNQQQYFDLHKTYEVTVLFGVETDTGDILGLINNHSYLDKKLQEKIGAELGQQLRSYRGRFEQTYPLYSSKPVDGRPLHEYARSGEEVEAPTKEVEIFSTELMSYGEVDAGELHKMILERIQLVRGDFRQTEVMQGWQEFFSQFRDATMLVAKIRIECSSGTYMRSLAARLGHDLGTHALALDIHRTRIGSDEVAISS